MNISAWHHFLMIVTCAMLTACNGGGGGGDDDPPPASTYSVGGAVTGLNGSPVVLHNNGGDALTISSSGEFSFATPVAQGSAYSITVATQPAGKTCAVSYGSGTVAAEVNNIAVSCVVAAAGVDPTGTNTLSTVHKPTLVGVVIDSPVINLNYDGSGFLDGATDSDGQFNYLPGELITFKIGDIALPAVVGQPVVTLFNFAGSSDLNNTVLVNIARFLQSLDVDGNPDNGITISAQAHAAGAGQSLDFSSPSFDSAANPIIAAAGGANTSLISGSTAIANFAAALTSLPKRVPIAGAWTTGTGVNMRAVILLENGWYYGINGNCGANAGYEAGKWAYSGTTLTLAVSDNANGSCGLNTGSRVATVAANSLTLDGSTWSDTSYSSTGLAGLYAYKGFIGEDVLLTLFTDTQYMVFEIDNGEPNIEVGTYTWEGNSTRNGTFQMLAVLNDEIESGTFEVQREGAYLLWYDGLAPTDMDVAVRPAKIATSLPGVWFLDESGDIADTGFAFPFIITADGRFMYLGNDATCPGRVNEMASGEIGTYAWDEDTSAISLAITGDSNGDCGIAQDALDVTSAEVNGNLLTFNADGVSVRPSGITQDATQNSAVGIWKQTSGSGALTLLVSQLNSSTLTIKAIDSNCAKAGTSYAVESLNATISAPNNIVQAASSTNYDTAACGLPTTLGPTYSIIGDTLTLGGVGTFIRQ